MLEFRRCSEAAVSLPPVFLIFDHALVEANGFGGLPPGYTEGLDWVSQGELSAKWLRSRCCARNKPPVGRFEMPAG